jgi:hypothetical protein
LEGFVPHLGEAGIGSIRELLAGEKSFTPRGRITQPWSVPEVLRCWTLDEAIAPTSSRQ